MLPLSFNYLLLYIVLIYNKLAHLKILIEPLSCTRECSKCRDIELGKYTATARRELSLMGEDGRKYLGSSAVSAMTD